MLLLWRVFVVVVVVVLFVVVVVVVGFDFFLLFCWSEYAYTKNVDTINTCTKTTAVFIISASTQLLLLVY